MDHHLLEVFVGNVDALFHSDYFYKDRGGKLVSGPNWVVRFQPPATGRDWVAELLAVIETWLQSAPLPCAKVRHGDHDYLVRAANNGAHIADTPWDAA